MPRNLIVLGLILVLLTSATYAQWREGGIEVEDTSWKKSLGDFGAMLMITNDPDGLFEAWDRRPSPDYGPSVREVSTARRGEAVMSFLIFSGCKPDGEGNCDCSVEYTAYFPDGRLYGRHTGEAWIGKPAVPSGQLLLSMENLGVRIEEDDPFGVYKIEAVLADRIAESELRLATELTVVGAD